MKRGAILAGAALLALTSALAIAQNVPESLLPPGFDKPRPKPSAPAVNKTSGNAPTAVSTPVVQPLPGASGAAAAVPAGKKIPSLAELEAMSPDELDELLGLKPKYDMPAAARRSMSKVGILAADEGGFVSRSFAMQDARLVEASLTRNSGQLVSRWGHILLRRALASRLDAPAGVNPADFAAWRAALLVRMGEGEAARALVQDVDAGNYTPALTQAALDSYAFTADVTGICPVAQVIGGTRKDADWRVLRAICAAFQGDEAGGIGQLDRLTREGAWPKVDLLLAQKYAGAAGEGRRAVKIEWDGVKDMNPWRYALTIAVGLTPPDALMKDAPRRYALINATAPMLGLEARAAGADRAAAAGILSSAAMVDLYGQIYGRDDIAGQWAASAGDLRAAYAGGAAADRMIAIRRLWDGGADPEARYSRQVLTAYAAARLPAESGFSKDAPDLVASMLSAGLDQNALRWGAVAEKGGIAWGMLALAAPQRSNMVDGGTLNSFYGNDDSESYRKSRFLLAGLAALGRVDDATAGEFAARLGVDLDRQTHWTRLIDQAAAVNNQALVAVLAGLGMQGSGWDKMTALHLYHIVGALNRVGLGAEARMIAAEAVARG
ncbi:MAG TPA: hypothetical protein PK479_04345 [Novosphingobium sp.]|nr:hypothetical protein [Novosphingobium sp.]HNN55980.1 hypothetical protein [Novosphingobium sp.]